MNDTKRYEEVKKYIESKGCKLHSSHYKNGKEKLDVECACGEHFLVPFDKFKFRGKTMCNKCASLKKGKSVMPLTYEQVKTYVESKGCELISTTFKNSHEKMMFRCSCGNLFETNFNKFKSRNKTHCNKCSSKTFWDYESVKRFVEVDSKSGCKLLSKEYSSQREKLSIQCKCGNIFETDLRTFVDLNKRTCDECSNISRIEKNKLGIDEISKFVRENSDCILLSDKYDNVRGSFSFRCGCGRIFETSFVSFKRGKRECDECSCHSTMENTALRFFEKNNIHYISQFTFDDLTVSYKKIKLKFDFAVFDKKGEMSLLELDGEQHYMPIKQFGGELGFKKTRENDLLKNKYCQAKNIKLRRISYLYRDSLETELNKIFL